MCFLLSSGVAKNEIQHEGDDVPIYQRVQREEKMMGNTSRGVVVFSLRLVEAVICEKESGCNVEPGRRVCLCMCAIVSESFVENIPLQLNISAKISG